MLDLSLSVVDWGGSPDCSAPAHVAGSGCAAVVVGPFVESFVVASEVDFASFKVHG